MGLTSLSLALLGEVNIPDFAGARHGLPAEVGPWKGQHVVFCQDEQCMRSLSLDAAEPGILCPTCGSETDTMSPGEKRLLPADTTILRRVYSAPGEERITISVVIMGADRTSIHRPQACLEGQGNRIAGQQDVVVEMTEGEPLRIVLLDLLRSMPATDGTLRRQSAAYAYWYTDGERTTPSFMRMQIWMALDRLFGKTARRWAYVSIASRRDPASDAHIARLKEFIAAARPLVSPSP